MRIFRRRHEDGGAAVADRPAANGYQSGLEEHDELADTEELLAEIARLTEANTRARDLGSERRLIALRHLVGMRRLGAPAAPPAYPEPDASALPAFAGTLPEIPRDALTPGLLRAALLRDGCLLVRGLIDRDRALELAGLIDRAFVERDRFEADGSGTDGLYEIFTPRPDAGEEIARDWIKMGGGVLAADSPRLSSDLLSLLGRAGFLDLVESYLGEPVCISAQKTTLRKAEPSVPGAWHQDGKFMGEVRALNLWLSLSRCGDVAPGLDVVPRRIGLVRTQTDEAMLDYQVSQRTAEEAAGDRPILRPIFEPGDALLFDDVFLHKTGSDPAMPNPRYAVESWFFGSSAFPREYAPLAV
jgi:hypothetical protein